MRGAAFREIPGLRQVCQKYALTGVLIAVDQHRAGGLIGFGVELTGDLGHRVQLKLASERPELLIGERGASHRRLSERGRERGYALPLEAGNDGIFPKFLAVGVELRGPSGIQHLGTESRQAFVVQLARRRVRWDKFGSFLAELLIGIAVVFGGKYGHGRIWKVLPLPKGPLEFELGNGLFTGWNPPIGVSQKQQKSK